MITRGTDETDANVVDEGDVVWQRDDFPPCGALTLELDPEHGAFISQVVRRRRVITDGTMFYIYWRSVASWAQLYSEIASGEGLKTTKFNAPVNYSRALKEIYAISKRVADQMPQHSPEHLHRHAQG
ncbi:hypothetical protein Z517_09304 [Fonsecaea pedrosoi CBS 271.37]|uniref:Uncharacterized protein n=1 Tax=Fonsecaea pedrosoi CBS 271.37 TaxID=1442368 RepID=A0A0D2GDX1_9EURO|nr:uncharacterized protein Z517_09304 [Fonsecaea pedrosoi CBS 271.37]KIW76860.1 hypothetical protein Z517_09304 [Fonsecaea pedrosoi CBS 271.37]